MGFTGPGNTQRHDMFLWLSIYIYTVKRRMDMHRTFDRTQIQARDATHVAQAMEHIALQKSRVTTLFAFVVGLPLFSHWQRSLDSQGSFRLVSSGLPFGIPSIFQGDLSFYRHFRLRAMSIVDCLKWQTFTAAQEDVWSNEAKSGVPRYDGEVSKLARVPVQGEAASGQREGDG